MNFFPLFNFNSYYGPRKATVNSTPTVTVLRKEEEYPREPTLTPEQMGPAPKRLQVQFPGRIHIQVVSLILVGACVGGN